MARRDWTERKIGWRAPRNDAPDAPDAPATEPSVGAEVAVVMAEPFAIDPDLAELTFPAPVGRANRDEPQLVFVGKKQRTPEAFLDTAMCKRPQPAK